MNAAHSHTAVVLVHGYFGYVPSFYWLRFTAFHRFLGQLGCTLQQARQPATGRVRDRARVLHGFLQDIEASRLLLVGHSMGGLDARYVATHLDATQRITDIITLGSPHRGTPVANEMLRDRSVQSWFVRFFDRGGLEDLTPEGAIKLNAEIPDRPDVHYISVAGRRKVEEMPPPYQPFARFLEERVGPNDGLVPVASAHWGHPNYVVEADHLEMIGAPKVNRSAASIRRPPRHFVLFRRILYNALRRDYRTARLHAPEITMPESAAEKSRAMTAWLAESGGGAAG